MLALLVSAVNAVNASAIARATDVRQQSNRFTAENDQPTPSSPPVTSPASPDTTGEGSAPAPQPATGGAGAMHGGVSDRCGCGGVVYVIGETMKTRVIPAAEEAGQRYYKPWDDVRATNDMMTRDRNWLLWVMRQGYWIRDIGYNTAPDYTRSAFYQMERDLIAEHNYPYYCFDPQP